MGNITYIIPTINLQDFNIDKIHHLISDSLEYLNVVQYEEHNSLQIHNKEQLITDMYFNDDCDILNFEQDIKDLKNHESELVRPLAQKLETLRDLNPDLNNCIQMTYGYFPYTERTNIEKLIHKYFRAYIFDEGIHPEFIAPDYIWKTPKKKLNFLKRFFN